MEHSAFPSDETLAAFIDGRLDEETRKRVVAHVADCEDCYGTVMAGRAWSESETASKTPEKSTAPTSFQYWLTGAVAAALAIGLLLQPVTARYRERRDQNAVRLAANRLQERSIDPRLSLDLEYRRLPQNRDAANEESGNAALVEAFIRIKQENDEYPGVPSRHSLGVVQLLLGDYDDAAAALADAIRRQTNTSDLHLAISQCRDVKLLNDLSAAFESQANHGGGTTHALARDAAERALRIDPHSAVAAWNRAVAIENSGDIPLAVPAWKDYLTIDKSSAWRTEAIERVNRLQRGRFSEP
ncbi:MAG TPA: zf-HC2 domain-containing protein [Gemmatimonadaceae bacterium]|nr:zf-HC2 domain-containing protein [Gemmatimonadaceae bacterium]